VFPEEFNGVPLVALNGQSDPDEMQVVGHQAIGGAKKPFARAGVELEFAKLLVKTVVQPAGNAGQHGHGPMNRGEGLIARTVQAREMMEVGIGHDWGRLKVSADGVSGKMRKIGGGETRG